MKEYSMEELAKLLTYRQVAELKNCPVSVVRRAARKNEIPGEVEVLGRTGFDPDLVMAWTPKEGTPRTVREDGRRKYWVWANEAEVSEMTELGYEVVDPRVAARARREARKAKKAASGSDAETKAVSEPEDPFADFGA